MKTRNLLAFIALSCMLIFTSCKKDNGSEGGIPDHLKIIPANSFAVMSINAKALVEKGDLDNYKDFKSYQKAHDEIARNEREMSKLVDEFLKDTRVSGLNLDRIYMYVQRIGEYDQLLAYTFGVDNSNNVGKWIAKVNKAADNDEYEIEEGNGYKAYRLNYRNILIWDKTKAVLLNVREDDEGDIPSFESILKIDEEYSIVSNPDFMECYNTQKDFTVWMSFKGVSEMNRGDEEFNQMIEMLGEEDWRNASMDFSLNFTDQKATFSMSVWPSSLVEKAKEKYPILNKAFEQSLLKYFPEQSFFTMKASLNIEEYYKAVVENISKYTEKLKEEQGEEQEEAEDEDDYYYYHRYSSPFGDYRQMEEMRSAIASDEVAKIVGLFKGDIVANVFGFKDGMVPMPKFGVAVTINGEQAFNYLLSLIPDDKIQLKKVDNYYTYSIPDVMDIYVGGKEDLMYITNSKEALDNFFAQGYQNNLSTSDIATDLINSPIFYSLNLDISKYPALATNAMKYSMGSMEYGVLTKLLEDFSSVNISYPGKNTVEMNFILKNKKENSLKVLLESIDSYATRMFGF